MASGYLSREEEAALLKTLRRDASPTGKRDYALFLLLLRTGWFSSVARRLSWGQVCGGAAENPPSFECRPQTARAGAPVRVKIPEEAWRAILDYLQASGRLDSIGPEEYIFAPSRAPLIREAGCNAGDWAGERPLSQGRLNALVKRRAQWSGLKAQAISCQTLRHTAAARCVEAARAAGEDPAAALRRELGWGSRETARTCRVRIRQKPAAPLIEHRGRRRGGRRPEPGVHGPQKFKAGHLVRLKHGLTAQHLPEMDWLEAQGIHLEGREREAARLRIVLARILTLSKRAKSIQEILWLSRAASRAARRLARMIEEKKAEEA